MIRRIVGGERSVWGAIRLAKGNISFVVAIIGRWKYGIGGGAGNGPQPSIFQNTQEKIEKLQIKVFATVGALDRGYSTKDSDFIVQGPLNFSPRGVFLAMKSNLFNPGQARKNMELGRFKRASPGGATKPYF